MSNPRQPAQRLPADAPPGTAVTVKLEDGSTVETFTTSEVRRPPSGARIVRLADGGWQTVSRCRLRPMRRGPRLERPPAPPEGGRPIPDEPHPWMTRRRARARRQPPPDGKPDPCLRNITRIDHGRGRSWWVRFERDGTLLQASFSDRQHGGCHNALRAAQRWRDEVEARLPPPRGGNRVGMARMIKPPGYHYLKRTPVSFRTPAGDLQHYDAWLCWLRVEDRKAKATRWSVDKHGDAAARAGCERWLEHQMQALLRRMRARAGWKPDPAAKAALVRWKTLRGVRTRGERRKAAA